MRDEIADYAPKKKNHQNKDVALSVRILSWFQSLISAIHIPSDMCSHWVLDNTHYSRNP